MRKKLFTKCVLLIIMICLLIKIVQVLKVAANPSSENQPILKNTSTTSTFPSKDTLHTFLSDTKNRLKVYTNANNLNNGDSANTCVYFLAEVIRQNGYNIPTSICNTTQIIDYLKTLNFKKNSDYKQLKPGDICFTTGPNSNKNVSPSHTYIFMGWVTPNNYDFAYICDNQAKDYDGKIYHKRNIQHEYDLNGKTKDPFSFFMAK